MSLSNSTSISVRIEGQQQHSALCFQQACMSGTDGCVLNPPIRAVPCIHPHNIISTLWYCHLLITRLFPWMQDSLIFYFFFWFCFDQSIFCIWFGLISFTVVVSLLFLLPRAEKITELHLFPKDTSFSWTLVHKRLLFPLWCVFIRGKFKCSLSLYYILTSEIRFHKCKISNQDFGKVQWQSK